LGFCGVANFIAAQKWPAELSLPEALAGVAQQA